MSDDSSPLDSSLLQSTYLQYLPALYSDPRESGQFVGQFLVPFEAEFEGLRDLLAEIDHFFTPALTSTRPDFLSWLAWWVALTLDESWDTEKRRKIIAEAVHLYRLRGTVKGLERFLEIYTGYVPTIQDGLWPGGFQIGVASRLPVLDAPVTDERAAARDEQGEGVAPVLEEIEAMERREPSKYDDYYVVRASFVLPPVAPLPEGHPLQVYLERLAVPVAEAGVGRSTDMLDVYYRADKVAAVTPFAATGKGAGLQAGRPSSDALDSEGPGVVVRLTAGREHRYSPASIMRQDQIIDERYDLTQRGQVILYRGDAYLIAATPLPYRFTVDLALPCVVWQYRFEALPLLFEEEPPSGDLPPEELEQRRAEFLARLQEAQEERAAQLEAVFADLAVGTWPEILRDDFEHHGVKLPPNAVVVQPDPEANTGAASSSEGPSATPQRPTMGWSVADVDGQVYVLAPRGNALHAYEWVACREWTRARRPDYVRRIRAIIDEVKPAHTIYTLRMARQEIVQEPPGANGYSPLGRQPLPPGAQWQRPHCGGPIDLAFRIGIESVIC